MLDTFRKRDNMRSPTSPQSGSRATSNGGVHLPGPGSSASRTENPPVKPVLLDPPAPAAPPLSMQAGAQTAAVPAETGTAAATETPGETPASTARLIVGPGIKLKGADITDCDTIIVEGEVDASMESRVVEIAERGVFRGKVEVDVAEIRGRFEGELTAHKRLVVHATGRTCGKIRYGKISVHEGGELSGDVAATEGDGQRTSSGGSRSQDLRAAREAGSAGSSSSPASAAK